MACFLITLESPCFSYGECQNIIVCKRCGYAASDREFSNLTPVEKQIIKEKVTPKWKEQDFTGERKISDGIVSFKLSLYQATLLGKKKSYTALLTLKIAWLYRILEDKNEEIKFMKMSLAQLLEAYETEDIETENMSAAQFTYLIGELHRRLGMSKESIKWFAAAIDEIKSPNPTLSKMIKEQRYLATEEYKKERIAS